MIDEAIGLKIDTPVQSQKKNQVAYEKGPGRKGRIQVGNYVYLDFAPTGAMDKGFDTKRNQIFRVIRIDAGKTPVLYKLEDLKKEPLKGYYYAEQLSKTAKPKAKEYFAVEKILGEKKIRGKEYVRVKYLHYSNKFNRWVPKENVLRGEK